MDTDIFSALYIDPDRAAKRGLPIDAWRAQLTGARVLISFQTRAEVIAGTQIGNWGERRVSSARDRLDSVPTVPADRDGTCQVG